jgi:hypothetical protein
MSTDAIVLLKNDHKTMSKLFRQFERAGDNAAKTKDAIVKKILEGLAVPPTSKTK